MSGLGWLARAALPGVRQVHAQVARYASEWAEANDRELAADGFHPGVLGYTDWAAAFAKALGVALP